MTLEEWREGLDPVLARLRDFELPPDFPFDYSADSLARLETVLLDRYPAGESFTESVTAYLGEALRRVGGGDWDWADDRPVLRPDPALGLGPISPLAVMADAVRVRDGERFAHVHAELTKAVDGRRIDRAKGADEVDVAALPRHPVLRSWLAEREAAFPEWAAGGAWDFSVDSLDALEELVTGRFAGVDEFKAAEPEEFLQGAAWYLGEVARRHRGAVWRYHEDSLGYAVSGDAWAGKPYVTQSGPDANTAQPIAELRVAVRKREPGTLRARFASFR